MPYSIFPLIYLNNEIGEKSLFPRTQKDCIFFLRVRLGWGHGQGRVGGWESQRVRGGESGWKFTRTEGLHGVHKQTDKRTDRQARVGVGVGGVKEECERERREEGEGETVCFVMSK